MTFNFLNQGQSGNIQQFTPIDTFIDPVSKIRVSNPSNLIDTDFEYGLQPTKWETVELINNTPAFFSKGGDTTIPDLTGITTNEGTREITVTTAFPHNLAVGIPIRVAGTKSVTADGSYIINATPSTTTFTYLARGEQQTTESIFDLYTSIITGEFFQGSQITISDAEGITTNGTSGSEAFSTLTVKTENNHGFGENTPFYFLNLNSTISQEFESQNTASVPFDPTNSAAAQTFDGSNTLLQTPVDLSNSATTSTQVNSIQTTDTTNASFTISINSANESRWESLVNGSPLYYDITAGSGYFQANPRGVVFIKDTSSIDIENNVATFQVSALPDGDAIPVVANIQGFFQVADQARTFAGNNINEQTEISLTVEVGQEFVFDGGNQGYDGDEGDFPGGTPDNVGTVVGYTGTTMTLFTAEGSLDYYEGSMLVYDSTGNAATGLVKETTYFVTSFAQGQSAGLFTVSIAELPGGAPIDISGGSGTQTFSRIGVSIDKNIIHIKNSNFVEDEMLQYISPENGTFVSDFVQNFYFVETAFDSHNYRLREQPGFKPMTATGGNVVYQITTEGRDWQVHQFTTVGTNTFTITDTGTEPKLEVLIVAGGGGGGGWGGGGGAGGLLYVDDQSISVDDYTITVGDGGVPGTSAYSSGGDGQNSSAFGLTAIGGGGGGHYSGNPGRPGGSGGGGGLMESSGGGSRLGGAGTPGQGFAGGFGGANVSSWQSGRGGGGGGATMVGYSGVGGATNSGRGGEGRNLSSQFGTSVGEDGFFAGGGGGHAGLMEALSIGGKGGGGRGGRRSTEAGATGALSGLPNTGGGGGGAWGGNANTPIGAGGSGIVIVRYISDVQD